MLHRQAIKQVAIAHNIVIAIRPVNKFAAFFIQEGYPSKPYDVKIKSTDIGMLAGLLVANPRYSQTPQNEFTHYSNLLNDSLKKNPDLKLIPCVLPEKRFHELKKYFANDLQIQALDHQNAFKITWKKEDEIIEAIAKKNEDNSDYTLFDEQGQAIQVLGKKIIDSENQEIIKPLTSDYDLLVICPPYDEFNPHGKDKTPFSTKASLYPIQAKIRASVSLFYLGVKEDPKGGNWSRRTQEIVAEINKKISEVDVKRRGRNLEMVHHNTEFDNPSASNKILPCIIFLPREMNLPFLPKSNNPSLILSIESPSALKKMFEALHQNKYYWSEHPKFPHLKAPKFSN